jgi:hypothetical protein
MRHLHLDPDGLRAAAEDLTHVLDTLEPMPPDPGVEDVLVRLTDGPGLVADHERRMVTIGRVTAELAELRTTLRHAAVAFEAADMEIADRLRRVGEQL